MTNRISSNDTAITKPDKAAANTPTIGAVAKTQAAITANLSTCP